MVKKGTKRILNQARSRQDKAQNKMLKSLASDVAQLKSSVEQKFSYQATAGVAIQGWNPTDNLSRSQNLFPIRIGTIQGITDANMRIGDQVNLKSIRFRYNLQLRNGLTEPAPAIARVRVVMFWDTECVDTDATATYILNTPQWQQLFQSPTLLSPAGTPLVMGATRNHDKQRRFQFLHDKVHTLTTNGNTNLATPPLPALGLGARSATGIEYVGKSYKIGRKLRYNGGGFIPINRALYIGFISDSDGTAVSEPILNFNITCLYEDA